MTAVVKREGERRGWRAWVKREGERRGDESREHLVTNVQRTGSFRGRGQFLTEQKIRTVSRKFALQKRL